jgi:hypothetical protein
MENTPGPVGVGAEGDEFPPHDTRDAAAASKASVAKDRDPFNFMKCSS